MGTIKRVYHFATEPDFVEWFVNTSNADAWSHNSDNDDPIPDSIRRVQADQIPDHLQSVYDNAKAGKSESEQATIRNILYEYQDVFSKDETDLGRTNLAEHSIDTGDHPPIKQPPRRVPTALAHEEKGAIEKMLAQNVIRESKSPWASPIVLVKKKSGSIRACVDYRRINSITRKDAYPIPRAQDCLDALSGSEVFSTVDMTSGFYQVPIREEDIPKTAFITKHGLYEYTVMAMGLSNSPSMFQRIMELAMRGLQWIACLIYLDDVIIFGRNFEEHANRLRSVLDRIRKAGLKLKPEKCELFQLQVRFLGHIVSAAGIKPDPAN